MSHMKKSVLRGVRLGKTQTGSLSYSLESLGAIKVLKIRIPEKFAVVILKFEQHGFAEE